MNSNPNTRKKPFIYDKRMNEARRFWREQCGTISLTRHISIDFPCPTGADKSGISLQSLQRVIDDTSFTLLQKLTKGNSFLLYTAELLVLQIACYQYSGKTSVTILSPARYEAEETTANILPVCSTLDPGMTFKELLVGTRTVLANAYQHQQYPFARILSDAGLQHQSASLPLLATAAGLHQTIADDYHIDVAFNFENSDKAITCRIDYDDNLYSEAAIEAFFNCFADILRYATDNMGATISKIIADYPCSATTPANTGEIEAAQEPGAATIRQNERIEDYIIARAGQHPSHPAVIHNGNESHYQTLLEQAQQLAGFLVQLKLDKNKPVAIWMDASAEMVVSILAVMMSGASFAPVKYLSTGKPRADILAYLDCECIISQQKHAGNIRPLQESGVELRHNIIMDHTAAENTAEGAQTAKPVNCQIWTSRDWQDRAKQYNSRSENNNDSNEIACVMLDFRNGQLSKTALSHQQILTTFSRVNRMVRMKATDRCLLLSGLVVNEQLYNILGMLIAGASIEIAETEKLTAASQLAEPLLSETITLWNLPTPLSHSLLPAILSLAQKRKVRGPSTILLSGEKQSPKLADMLRQIFPQARVLGLYGAPAVGIWHSYFALQEVNSKLQNQPADPVPTRSLPGFDYHVLNASNHRAATNMPGNLYVQWQERLIPTGLRACKRGDGSIAWLRGKQHHVVRQECVVELTKIAFVLCCHPAIDDAEVTVMHFDDNNTYVESIDDPAHSEQVVIATLLTRQFDLSADQVREFLSNREEAVMIPEQFIILAEYPLTLAGDIDYNTLFERWVNPRKLKAKLPGAKVLAVQEQLRDIWLDTLQLEKVPADESFFTLGGNSLKATLLISRIRDVFSVDLSVQDFFRKPSLRAIAQLISDAVTVNPDQKESDLKPVSRKKYRVQSSES